MIYVDVLKPCTPNRSWPWPQYCLLSADSLEELRTFAGKLGLKREWFCAGAIPNYKLTEGLRWKAVRLGAIQLDEQQCKVRQERATAFHCDWCRRACNGSMRAKDKAVCSENCRKIVEAEA